MNSSKRYFALFVFCLNLFLVPAVHADTSGAVASNAKQANSTLYQKLKNYFQAQIGSVNLEQQNTATDTTNPATNLPTDGTRIPQGTRPANPLTPFQGGVMELSPDVIREILTGGRVLPGGGIARFHEGEGMLHADISPDRSNASHPAIAYDPDHHRYLVVWDQEEAGGAKNVYGQLVPVDGAPLGTPQLLSTVRMTEHCFASRFADVVHSDPQWARVTIPTTCNVAQNPSVAYNNGHFLVTWELGTPNTTPANSRFSGIIAKLIDANATNLAVVSPNWEEGILISGSPGPIVSWEAERAMYSTTPPRTIVQDSDIFWTLHTRPRVAPNMDGDGFLVTWETDTDFNYCEADRRASSSIYGRHITSNFSRAGGSTNPARFVIYTDTANAANRTTYQTTRDTYVTESRAGRHPSFPVPNCAALNMVTKATKPDLAFNQMNHRFLVVFETAAAAGAGSGNIAAKLVALAAMRPAQVFGEGIPLMAQAAMGQIYHNPSVASFGDTVQLAYDNGMDIFVKSIRLMDTGMIPMPSVTEAQSLSAILSASALRTNPTLSSNLGVGGIAPMGMRPAPDRLVVAWRDGSSGSALNATVLDNNLRTTRNPNVIQISPVSITSNSFPAAASDLEDFYVTWVGGSVGVSRILGAWVNSQDGLLPPTMLSPDSTTPLSATTTSVPLTWSAVAGATAYEVFVGAGTDTPTSRGMVTSPTTRLDFPVTMNTTYRWYVRARDAGSRRSTSTIASFGIGIVPVSAPTGLMPDGTTLPATTTSIPLTWNPVMGATSYEVFVGAGSTEPISRGTVMTNRMDYTMGLSAGMTYRWYVIARSGMRASVPSTTATFGIGVAPLDRPTGLSPCGAPLAPGAMSATLQWNPVMGTGIVYDVLMDSGTAMTPPTTVVMAGIPASSMPSFNVMGLTPATTYRWKVRVRDGMTPPRSQDSDVCTFTTSMRPNTPPTMPALAAQPADNVTWAPTRLYLSWTASTDADGDPITYDVYFVSGSTIPTTARPYKSGLTFSGPDTPKFIIQASTDARPAYTPDSGVTPIYLSPMQNYAWKICARDNRAGQTCSETRRFNTDNSVVGWWRFDENPAGMPCPSMPGVGGPAGDPGETVCDYSGFGNHGVPRGGPTWLPAMSGILGGALQFDGVDDWVEVANNGSLNPTQISIETTQILGAFGAINLDRRIVSKLVAPSTDTGYLFGFGFGNDFGLSIGIDSGGLSLPSSVLGSRYHLIGTFNGTATRIYTNGSLAINFPLVRAIVSNGHPLEIGHTVRFNSFYVGEISEIIVYSAAITDIQSQNAFLTQ